MQTPAKIDHKLSTAPREGHSDSGKDECTAKTAAWNLSSDQPVAKVT